MSFGKIRSGCLVVAVHVVGAVAPLSLAQDLTLVTETGYYYLEIATIEIRDALRTATWEVEYDWDHHLPSNESYRYAVVRHAYDCTRGQYTVISRSLYKKRGSDPILRSETNELHDLAWSNAEASTIEARQLEAVCTAPSG